jgi:nucleolar protein 12
VKPVEPVEPEKPTTLEATNGSPSKRKREDEEPVAGVSSRKGKKGKKSKKAAAVEEVVQPEAVEETADVTMEEDASAGSEMEQDNEELASQIDEDNEFVHESKRGPADDKAAQKKQKKIKFAPEDESKTDRDRRTIFIGNLPVETAKSKVSTHQT